MNPRKRSCSSRRSGTARERAAQTLGALDRTYRGFAHPESADVVIRAAGAVLWRPGPDGPLVAVIHRPKYDDWTLPKGKLTEGENDLDAALREVREETGCKAQPGKDLGSIDYVSRGERKTVRYWAMRSLCGSFTPTAEVDELRWVSPADALRLLTYPRDQEVVNRFLADPV